AIFGIGGSSLLLKVLAGMGIKNIKAIDYDIVESSNLSRQYIYSLEDIGRLKTEAAKDSINKYKLDEENSFQFFNQRIES
ncbi:ThiF family adenylyltransferase, partial [Mammaliicoccus sciuri]